MKPINDGGQAFPMGPSTLPNGDHYWGNDGMSLRDYFAGKALSMLASGDIDHEEGWDDYARIAYKAADAMIAARSAKQ